MTGAELLWACRRQRALVRSHEEKIAQLEAEKTSIRSPGFDEAVQTSHKADISDILIQIENNIIAEQKAYRKLKQLEKVAAEAIAEFVTDPLVQAVLRNRYLLYKSVPETAVTVEYSEDYVKELQGIGLAELGVIEFDDETLSRIF